MVASSHSLAVCGVMEVNTVAGCGRLVQHEEYTLAEVPCQGSGDAMPGATMCLYKAR